ncbi:MAG: hypothetical protein RBR41_02425 [Desulfovibrio sp.]|uniref:hypothetical protein n=1 Tax=Desulfovibrio sp. TaxID=885 RepID=UPI002A35FE75|nr:hypothetical protein [Desulfovibrio sp.]MDY0258507.1 hypothetical protein [Desulfovibrio sp.]
MKIYPDVHSFVGGLLTAKLEGRVDYSKYGVGCRVLENFIVTPTGGIYKRPGLRFVSKAKANGCRLIPFDFNGTDSQSYVLEIGDGYIRFFTRGGQLMSGNAPMELAVGALNGVDVTKLRYVQSADVIYFAHPDMQPWRLERLSATSWAYQGLSFITNSTEPLPFAAGNYPSLVRIYEDRLVYAGTPKQPLNIWMSKMADFTNFNINTQSDQTKEPLAEDAIFLRINGSRVNPIKWMLDMEQLVVGTNASEIRIQGSDIDSPLTPSTTGHKRQSSYGSCDVQAILLGSSAMFVSRTGTNVYTLDYQDFGYRFKAAPLNLLCPEATSPDVVEMHSMSEPEPIAWCILSDGTFSGCTYIRDQQIFAWHKHRTQGKVKSGAIIPYIEGDQFWVAVERNGETFIEYLETPFDVYAEDATYSVFMDAMLTGTTDETGIIKGMPYLAGRSVQVMQDGSYLGELEVDANGSVQDIKIRKNAYVAAGLGYTAEVQPMRINYPLKNGQGVNFKKRIVSVMLRVLGSIKGDIRTEYEQPIPALNRPGEYGQWQEILAFSDGAIGGKPPPCLTKTIEVSLSGNTTFDGLIRVRQGLPFPLFITSIAFGIEQGG